MTAAAVAGASVWFWGTGAVLLLMTVTALLVTTCVIGMRERDVDNRLACGLKADAGSAALPRLSVLLSEPALLIGGGNKSGRVCCGHRDNFAGRNDPVALYAARRAPRTRYLTLITAALSILPMRAAVDSLGDYIAFMPVIQVLDGVAAGLLGVAVPGFVVRGLDGKGHTNAGQSFILLMQGAGAALSPDMTGTLISHYSYSAAFAVIGALTALALIIWVGGAACLADGDSCAGSFARRRNLYAAESCFAQNAKTYFWQLMRLQTSVSATTR
ncbi:MAG: hypothetical protein FT726_05035 [Pantoea sp. Morm]|uniref:hypothetical protein n=1 Tax=Pantoea sp. Morm TaxID=2601250 RepID=UPI001DD9B695|nr:hypothetical protein [Pantoea sp. Morm]